MLRSAPENRSIGQGQEGFTLFELLIAMLLLAMISVMIYSILNVGIKFTDKGDKAILAMERRYGFLSLLQRQVKSAVYDAKQKKLLVTGEDEVFRIVNRSPLINRSVGVVLSVYYYDASEGAVYYTEKKDYYNTDYDEDYVPELEDMAKLVSNEEGFSIVYDGDAGPEVTLTFRDEEYVFIPKCLNDEALSMIER